MERSLPAAQFATAEIVEGRRHPVQWQQRGDVRFLVAGGRKCGNSEIGGAMGDCGEDSLQRGRSAASGNCFGRMYTVEDADTIFKNSWQESSLRHQLHAARHWHQR